MAWLLGFISLVWLLRSRTPPEVWTFPPAYLPGKWVRRATPLLMNSCILSMMAGSGVITLEWLYPSQPLVDTYAVVAQTGTFIVLLANTTNRFYLPLVSLYLERHDTTALHRLLNHRLRVVGALAFMLSLIVLLYGKTILGWFGPHFRQGYTALCVIAVGASINALFSDSPYYLQFVKRSQDVLHTTIFAMVLNAGLTAALSYHLGMLGAAYDYSISMSMFFLIQRAQVSHHLRKPWRRASG